MSAPDHSFRILVPQAGVQAGSEEFGGRCALTVMAKAPAPGRVKTRLSPPLTPAQCAALNASFLRDTVENLRLAAMDSPAQLVISYTPAGEEHAFTGILPEGILLLAQRGDAFGERLLCTAQDLFACGFDAVCLIDSDSPTVPTEAFARAARTLIGAKDAGQQHVILGESEDGGYYLLGMNEPMPLLFERIAWSTSAVAHETRARIAECGASLTLLETWYDVDDGASLAALRAEFAGRTSKGYPAPHTRAYLDTIHQLEEATP